MSLKGVNTPSRVAQERVSCTKGKVFMKTRCHSFRKPCSCLLKMPNQFSWMNIISLPIIHQSAWLFRINYDLKLHFVLLSAPSLICSIHSVVARVSIFIYLKRFVRENFQELIIFHSCCSETLGLVYQTVCKLIFGNHSQEHWHKKCDKPVCLEKPTTAPGFAYRRFMHKDAHKSIN